jgi:hypothetical protein
MQRFKYLFASMLLATVLVGCKSTWNNSTKINGGMTKTELIAAIGPPEDAMSPGMGVEVLRYTFKKQRLYRLAVPLKKIYLVRLEDGRVTAYGTERDLVKAAPRTAPGIAAPEKNEKNLNVNVRTDSHTNSIAPVDPGLNINAN